MAVPGGRWLAATVGASPTCVRARSLRPSCPALGSAQDPRLIVAGGGGGAGAFGGGGPGGTGGVGSATPCNPGGNGGNGVGGETGDFGSGGGCSAGGAGGAGSASGGVSGSGGTAGSGGAGGGNGNGSVYGGGGGGGGYYGGGGGGSCWYRRWQLGRWGWRLELRPERQRLHHGVRPGVGRDQLCRSDRADDVVEPELCHSIAEHGGPGADGHCLQPGWRAVGRDWRHVCRRGSTGLPRSRSMGAWVPVASVPAVRSASASPRKNRVCAPHRCRLPATTPAVRWRSAYPGRVARCRRVRPALSEALARPDRPERKGRPDRSSSSFAEP